MITGAFKVCLRQSYREKNKISSIIKSKYFYILCIMSKYIVHPFISASIAIGVVLTIPAVYKKLSSLNELRKVIELTDTLSDKKTNVISSILKTCKLLYMALTIMIHQRLYGSIIVGKNFSYVSYFHNMKWYYFPLLIKRGPKPVITKVINEKNNDITEFITRIAGPNVDFYNQHIKPRDIKSTKLIITVDGEDKIFEENDIITC